MKKPRPSSNIPEARERLLAIAGQLLRVAPQCALEIHRVVRELMVRGQTNTRRAPTQRVKLTPPLAARIRAFKLAHPEYLQDDIARTFGCGGGRVSEALAGHDYSPRKPPRK